MSTENEGAIRVIVELQAKPGKPAELKNLIESVAGKYGRFSLVFLAPHAMR
jgi:hypothetical protein